ncbi:hypothetical protein QEN19_004282 [Hanseniaspora menglaensis]
MGIKTIYLLRHGYRSNWLPEPHPPSPTGIEADVLLAQHGLEQAEELSEYINSDSFKNKPQLIISSPFIRCIQTIRPTAKKLDLEIVIEKGIGEWFKKDRCVETTVIDGIEQKTVPLPANLEKLHYVFEKDNLKMNKYWETVIPNIKGESKEDIQKRAFEVLPLLIERIEKEYPEIESVLLCTHAATKIALGMAILGYEDLTATFSDVKEGQHNHIRAAACSLDKFYIPFESKDSFYDRDWTMTMNGNTSYLTKGEEMHWDFRNGFEAGSDADIKYREEIAKLEAKHGVDMTSSSTEETSVAQRESRAEEGNENFEEHFVEVGLPKQYAKTFAEIPKTGNSTDFQVSGMNTDGPLFKVGNKIYQGEWEQPIGSSVVTIPGINDESKSKNDSSNMKSIENRLDLNEIKIKK